MPPGPALIAFDGSDAARAGLTTAAQLLAVREAVIETVWMPYSGVAAAGVIGAPGAIMSRATEEIHKAIAAGASETAHNGVRLAASCGLEAHAEAMETAGPVWCALRTAQRRTPRVVPPPDG